MARKNDQYDIDNMDKNIKKLLVSAFALASASASFRRSLLVRLKEEVVRLARGISRQSTNSPALEQNLGRLMASAAMPVEALPSFKGQLRYQLVAAAGAEQRKRSLRIWATALTASAVSMVLILGMVIYPAFWADRGVTITTSVSQNVAQLTQIKPVFFNLGSRAVTTTLNEGDKALLSSGDQLVTGNDATSILTLPGDNTITLYPESKIIVGKLIVGDDNIISLVCLKLDYGMASNRFSGLMVDIDTPIATASIKGTAFRIEVVSPDHTSLITREGTVQLTMEGDTVQVSAGEQIDAIKGQPLVVEAERPPILIIETPDKPEVYSATIALSGKTDVEATLTVNGEPVQVDVNGSFSTNLSLEPGPNPVSITATSPTGKATALNLIIIRK